MADKDPHLLKGEDFLVDGKYLSFTLEISKAEHVTRKNSEGELSGTLLWFVGAKKPLFCPDEKINQRLLKSECGTIDPEQLVGCKVTMIPVKGNWFGETNTLAIRILVTGDKPRPSIKAKVFGKPVTGLEIGNQGERKR